MSSAKLLASEKDGGSLAESKRRIELVRPVFLQSNLKRQQRTDVLNIVHQAAVLAHDYAEVAAFVRTALVRVDGAEDWCVLVGRNHNVALRPAVSPRAWLSVPALKAELPISKHDADRAEKPASGQAFHVILYKNTGLEGAAPGRLASQSALADAVAALAAGSKAAPKKGAAAAVAPPAGITVLRSGLSTDVQALVLAEVAAVKKAVGLTAATDTQFAAQLRQRLNEALGATWHLDLLPAAKAQPMGPLPAGAPAPPASWAVTPHKHAPGFAVSVASAAAGAAAGSVDLAADVPGGAPGRAREWMIELTLAAGLAVGEDGAPVLPPSWPPKPELPGGIAGVHAVTPATYHIFLYRTVAGEDGGEVVQHPGGVLGAYMSQPYVVARLVLYTLGIVAGLGFGYFGYVAPGLDCARPDRQVPPTIALMHAFLPDFLQSRMKLGELLEAAGQGADGGGGEAALALKPGCTLARAQLGEANAGLGMGLLYVTMAILGALSILRFTKNLGARSSLTKTLRGMGSGSAAAAAAAKAAAAKAAKPAPADGKKKKKTH